MHLTQRYTEENPRARAEDGAAEPARGILQAPPLTFEGAIFPSPLQRFAPYLVEFLGAFILTATFVYNYRREGDLLWSATSNGLMVTALTYAFAHISGANLNPSISLALLMSGRQSARAVGRLCMAQILGAASAAALLNGLTRAQVNIGPINEHTWRAVILVEMVYTGVLCFVYLNCAASTRNNPSHKPNGFLGLAMGFTFVAGGYAAREISHTVMNSAIAVGLTVVDCRDGFSLKGMGYFLADIAGAFFAAGAYRLTRPVEADHRDEAPLAMLAAATGSSQSISRGSLGSRAQASKRLRMHEANSARIAAEFFGTFVVIFTKALNRLGTATAVGPEAWSVAAALMSMVYALRDVSGAYFNPAVTLAAYLSGRANIACRSAVFYVVAQMLAGVAATSLFAAMNNGKPMPLTFGARASAELTMYTEGCFTFLTAYVVLAMTVSGPGPGTATPKDDASVVSGVVRPADTQNDIAGFAYGACHVAGGFAVGHFSGAMFNPAVVFSFSGIDIFHGQVRGDVMLYVIWQLLGALLATGTFMVTHARLYSEPEEEIA